MAAVDRKLVHKQFNSPIGLYSDQNIKETLDREIKGFGGSGIDTSDQQRQNNLANSAVLRMLQEEEEEQTYTAERKSRPRQRTILDRNAVLQINRIHLDRRDYSWPPEDQQHIYYSPEQYIVSRYDRKRINNDHSIEFLSENKKRMETTIRSKSATNKSSYKNNNNNNNLPIISRDQFLNEVKFLNDKPIAENFKTIPKRYKSFENLNMSSKEMSNKNIPEIRVTSSSCFELFDSSKLNKEKSKSISELPPQKPRSEKNKTTNQDQNNNNNNNKRKINKKLIVNKTEKLAPMIGAEKKEEYNVGNVKTKRSTLKFQISCNEFDNSITTTINERPILQQSFSYPLTSSSSNRIHSNSIINSDDAYDKNSEKNFNQIMKNANFQYKIQTSNNNTTSSGDDSSCCYENKQNLVDNIQQRNNYVIVTNELNNDINNNIKTSSLSEKTTTSERTLNSMNENIQLTGCTTKFDNKIQSDRNSTINNGNNNININTTTTTRSNNNNNNNNISSTNTINENSNSDTYVTNKDLINEISETALKQNIINFNQNDKFKFNQDDISCNEITTSVDAVDNYYEDNSKSKKEIKVNSINDLDDDGNYFENTHQNDNDQHHQSKIQDSTEIIQIINNNKGLKNDNNTTADDDALAIPIMSPPGVRTHINQYFNVDDSSISSNSNKNIINNLAEQQIDMTKIGLISSTTTTSCGCDGQHSIIKTHNDNKIDEHEINFDKKLFDIKPKLYPSPLSQIENMPIVENILLDLYNVSLILGDAVVDSDNNNKARIVEITNEKFSNNQDDINSQFDKIFDEHQIKRPSESSIDGNQSDDRSSRTTTTTDIKSKNYESFSESTISGTSTPENIIIKSRNIPGGFIIRNHSPSNDFDIINLLFDGNKEHTQNYHQKIDMINMKNKFLIDTDTAEVNELKNNNNCTVVVQSLNENSNNSNNQLKDKQQHYCNNNSNVISTTTTTAALAVVTTASAVHNIIDNKINYCNNSLFDSINNNENEIYLQQLKEELNENNNIYFENQQQHKYQKTTIEDSSIDMIHQEAGTKRGRLKTRHSSDNNSFKARSISQPLPYKTIDVSLQQQQLPFKNKVAENQYYSSLPHLADESDHHRNNNTACNNSQEQNFNKKNQKLSSADHHLNVDRNTVLKINRWRRKREFQWPPLEHELRSRSISADREGYKRVAWPPSSEQKPFVREFTPQPQSQDGQATYQANQSNPNQYPQKRQPQPSQQSNNPSYQSQQPNQYPSNQPYLHPGNVQQQSHPSYQSQQQPNQYPSNQPYVTPNNVQQHQPQQHQQQQHKQPNQYPSNQPYVHPSNIQQPNQYQPNASPSNPHPTNYPQQQKTIPYESNNLYDGPKKSPYSQSTPSAAQNSYHPQQNQQQQYNNQNSAFNSNEPQSQGQLPYASQSKPQFGQQNQPQRNWNSVQAPGNRQQQQQQYQPFSNEAQHITENDDSRVYNSENMGQEYTSPPPQSLYGQMPQQTGTSNPYYPQQQHAGVPQSYNPQQAQSQTGAASHPYYGQQSQQQNPNAPNNAYHPQHLQQQTGSFYPHQSQQPNAQQNAYQSQQQQYNQQAPHPVDATSPNLGTIKLRQETPVSQKPAPIIQSQPAARSFRGGSIMRGDLKWPPPDTRDRMEEEAEHARSLALGPQFKPRKLHKDYAPFFEKHALPHNWPGYKVPPGTQHIEAMY